MQEIWLSGQFETQTTQDPNKYREQVFDQNENGPIIQIKEMTEDEKKTRTMIIKNNLNFESYSFYEDVDCPQQKPGS